MGSGDDPEGGFEGKVGEIGAAQVEIKGKWVAVGFDPVLAFVLVPYAVVCACLLVYGARTNGEDRVVWSK